MKSRNPAPPKLAKKFLLWFLRGALAEEVQGDLEEQFYATLRKKSATAARFNYWYQVFNYLRPFAISKYKSTNSNFTIMFRHNLIISVRNLKQRKAYTIINILGLTLGIAGTILIVIMVKYHLSFDAFHANADRVYRVITEHHQEKLSYTWGVPAPIGEAIRKDFTFAEEVAMVTHLSDRLVAIPSSKDCRKFKESIAFAEPAFFGILDFPLIEGNKNTILTEPNTAVITARIAKKYFGGQDPIGQTISLDNKLEFVITGILQDLPANTDRQQEIYLSYANLREYNPGLDEEGWWYSTNRGRQCFVLLKPHVSPIEVNRALSAIPETYYDARQAEIWKFKLQPLSDIHFNPNLGGYVEKKNLWALSFIGLFLIISACINFINLATARALDRSKEIGVRKVLGGLRKQLFWQFMMETAIISILAMALAVFLAHFALPFVNRLFQAQISVNIFQSGYLLIILSILLVTIVFLSGFYPGLIIAGFKPVPALKGKLTQRHIGGFPIRRGLILTQFAISQLLIIGTIVIASQMRYAQQGDMGFEKDAIVMLPLPSEEKSKLNTLRTQFLQITGVDQMTFCNAAPASEINPSTGIKFDSRAEGENFSIFLRAGDHNYISTFDLKIVEGRNLHPSDTIREYLINETAVKKLGAPSYQDVIGKTVAINGREGTIVGILKDFHNKSFHEAIDPIYLTTLSSNFGSAAVKVNLTRLKPTLTALEKVWKQVYPDHVYEYNFLDEHIAKFYELENMMLGLIQVFAVMAIVIACLGLYGLVSFMATQKIKEIGIRKVLGAGIGHILWLFGKEFTRLLIMAFAVAAPLAWWIMRNWLDNFTYRIEIGINIFLIALSIAFLVAVITVGYQSVRAAMVNPVNSLRSE